MMTAVSPSRLTRYRWLWYLLAFILLTLISRFFIVPVFDYPNKDFMTLWAGGRAFVDGVDQYDPAGWVPLFPKYNSEWIPNQTNPYPIWASVLLLPFAVLPVEWGAALWLAVSELLLAVILWQVLTRVYGYQPVGYEPLLLFLAGFTAIPNILIVINGQFTYILLAILALFLLFCRQERPFTAGFTLSFLLLKPNPFLLFLPLIGLWLLIRRDWRMMAGGLSGGTFLLVIGWLIQPTWLTQWFAIRTKTAVVTITPTLWGLSAEIAPNYWFVVGMALVVGFTAVLAHYLFTHPNLPMPVVISLALAGSLLITPYGWTYEHALLFIPWLWAFATIQPRKLAQTLFGVTAFVLPWMLFLISAVRLQESFSFIVPLATIALVLFTFKRLSPTLPTNDTHANGRS